MPIDQVPLDPITQRFKLIWFTFFESLIAPNTSSYVVAGLPTSAKVGATAYASDGRKPGESAGAGTGVLVYYDNNNHWISVHSGTSITA